MQLLKLRVENFRNLGAVELAPSAHSTLVVGPNGQGKTNLLEAIYYLMTLRPLRPVKLAELIRFGAERARVSGRFALGGAERELRVELVEGKRELTVDGKRTGRLERYLGGVSVVSFTPDDLRVVKGSPEGRRQFLDRAVFNRFPALLGESRAYAKALKARNRLLKERADLAYLEAYEVTLSRAGARILALRRNLLGELVPGVERAFSEIARSVDGLSVRYLPAAGTPRSEGFGEEELARTLRTALAEGRQRDFERGFTSLGPHADDLELLLGGRPARAFASQGQMRAMVLAWKVAEIENLARAQGHFPLLLLDDVSSELDPERNRFLMGYLAAGKTQVFLTTTDATAVRGAAHPDSVWLEMREGAC